jgi:signal transduction histidine kinase
MNLLVNAASYSRDGSPIDVDARARDGGIMLSVRDRGVGIPPEDLPHIFGRFFRSEQTRAAHAGYGLGLYVAHALVVAHGGHIDVDSTPGVGTTFRVWLPAVRHE